jgi:hypothetical protein
LQNLDSIISKQQHNTQACFEMEIHITGGRLFEDGCNGVMVKINPARETMRHKKAPENTRAICGSTRVRTADPLLVRQML